MNTESIGNVLLWGGRSKGRILCMMIEEQYNVAVSLIYDYTLDNPEFPSSAKFINTKSELLENLKKGTFTHFAIGIGGSAGLARHRTARAIAENFDLKPLEIKHPRAFIDSGCQIGEGLQMMPGALIHKLCKIGENVIVNSNATLDHECIVGHGVHIMGNAAVAGRVTIGDFVSLGTNCTILPDIKIGKSSYVGAGSVVTKDVEPNSVVIGAPAKFLKTHNASFDFNSIVFY